MAATAPTAPAATAPAAKQKYTTADTDIGTLLDDPAAKAIIEKHIPGFTTNEQVDMARGMTLKAVQAYASDEITDERLAAIDADFAKLK
jgi:para-nitrobenzyl esterase